MRILVSLVFVLTVFPSAAHAGADEAPLCESRIVGESYRCIAKTSDPAGICYVNCMTAVDTPEGFNLEERKYWGLGEVSVRHCTCADDGDDLPGPRWFKCDTDDGLGVMTGKVAPRGRRVRNGFTDYDAFTDVFTCERATECTPEFNGCSQLGVE